MRRERWFVNKRMPKERGPLIAAVLWAAGAASSCHSQYPPQRPTNVPESAVWAGGIDGGGWVVCVSTSECNECTTYSETGTIFGPRRFVLKGLKRPARLDELNFEYVDGSNIGLSGNLVLVELKAIHKSSDAKKDSR
jgi:hypothetical protein